MWKDIIFHSFIVFVPIKSDFNDTVILNQDGIIISCKKYDAQVRKTITIFRRKSISSL